MKYNCIFWDWNGTLLDDIGCGLDTLNHTLAIRSMPTMTKEEYLESFHFPVKDYYLELGFDFEKESFETLAVEYNELFAENSKDIKLFGDAREVLAVFKTKGVKQYILTACEKTMLLGCLEKYDIGKYFDGIYALDDVLARSKIELGRQLLATLNENDRVLMVGDTVHDYEVATALGVDCVLCPRGHASRKKLATTGVPIIETLTDLYPMILRQMKKGLPPKVRTCYENETRSFDTSEAEPKDFRTRYKDFYDDLKNTNKTEDW